MQKETNNMEIKVGEMIFSINVHFKSTKSAIRNEPLNCSFYKRTSSAERQHKKQLFSKELHNGLAYHPIMEHGAFTETGLTHKESS